MFGAVAEYCVGGERYENGDIIPDPPSTPRTVSTPVRSVKHPGWLFQPTLHLFQDSFFLYRKPGCLLPIFYLLLYICVTVYMCYCIYMLLTEMECVITRQDIFIIKITGSAKLYNLKYIRKTRIKKNFDAVIII